MDLYSYKGNYPEVLPQRIRLSNGLTRTNTATFTAEEIADTGYILAENPPIHNELQKLVWAGTQWQVIDFTEEEIAVIVAAEWKAIREKRDTLLKEVDWRVLKYESQKRLEVETTDSIENLDKYAQELRDVTKQDNPQSIVWPTLGNVTLDDSNPVNY
jgi:hypothetical protein